MISFSIATPYSFACGNVQILGVKQVKSETGELLTKLCQVIDVDAMPDLYRKRIASYLEFRGNIKPEITRCFYDQDNQVKDYLLGVLITIPYSRSGNYRLEHFFNRVTGRLTRFPQTYGFIVPTEQRTSFERIGDARLHQPQYALNELIQAIQLSTTTFWCADTFSIQSLIVQAEIGIDLLKNFSRRTDLGVSNYRHDFGPSNYASQ